ncbi:RHS repeat-associated core domain-containing protein [Pseudomonas sp. UMAB-40]|uniref:RHS repeat-associated core domain-containing protein n=1 Tax=Pseudomonas sp. UMAB-40 TaxID=1365407 RepID=UPI001C56134D|nr:RHS repeat-associated core domain-containing protein [Pseudomonas sp. UMAB-40]
MSVNVHRHTPTLNVVDGRGLALREVRYLCNESLTTPEAHITRYRHDISGQAVEHYSPTATVGLSTADSRQVSSLSGATLLVDSLDAGRRLTFWGEAGQALDTWDSRGSHWQTDYDNQLRPLAIHEKSAGQSRQVIERFTYAGSSTNDAQTNRCGRLIRRDDPAGSVLFSGYDLTGKLLGQIRHLLNDQHAAHWPEDLEDRKGLLESGTGHTTTWRYAPTGEVLEQTDARGHTQRFGFDVAGQLDNVTLQLSGTTQQRLIFDQVRYNALGQIESQVLGGKITSAAVYAPENGRMIQRSISRANTHILQKLQYAYDAVGNVLSVEDHSKPEQHNSNQRVVPVSTYGYDSLYQLVKATGREEQAASSRAALPEWLSSPADRSRLLNFTQHYTYDERGNLTKLQHQREGNNYTRELRIAPDSNRGLSWKTGDPPPDFATGFDANGNLQALQSGQPLLWNARNQLQSVTLVERAAQEADTESYLYDGSGQRVRKRQTQKAHALTRCRDVVYLPGLEIRESTSETLEVITVQAGHCNVQCLHWSLGTPSAITNNALRFGFDDHLGSNTIELDAEGQLISEEGYYPFGGTAWRAARNVLEANYRTLRYSGKERDASGLYYYGQRYYAPWLQRWISPDPAGTADGLNLYCMAGNNPVRFADSRGLVRDDLVNVPTVLDYYDRFSLNTVSMTDAPRLLAEAKDEKLAALKAQFPKRTNPLTLKEIAGIEASHPAFKAYTKKKLNEYTAHAAVTTADGSFSSWEHFNFPEQLGDRPYPGVTLYRNPFPSSSEPGDLGIFEITRPEAYMAQVGRDYTNRNDVSLHPALARDIRDHLGHSGHVFPIQSGTPGRHAEVRSRNALLHSPLSASVPLENIFVMTQRLKGVADSRQATDFPTCMNCNALIPRNINIPTGRLEPMDYAAHMQSMRSSRTHYQRAANP